MNENVLTQNIAKHFREVFFGGNWTVSNVRDQLKDVSWEQALRKVDALNNIATLTFHIGYFVRVAARVLEGGPLEGKDAESFAHPPVTCKEDWEQQVSGLLDDAAEFAKLVERLPAERMWEPFAGEKYGSCYRNVHGIIEHTHYHLGQIALVKKLTG